MNIFKRLRVRFSKKCEHWDSRTSLFDIHTGGNGEWYVRGAIKCSCGWKKTVAIPLPESLSLDGLDKSAYYEEERAKTTAQLKAWEEERARQGGSHLC